MTGSPRAITKETDNQKRKRSMVLMITRMMIKKKKKMIVEICDQRIAIVQSLHVVG